jgi:secretion/DNA translocation related TadE-like protein
VLGLSAVLGVFGVSVVLMGAAMTARHRASTAADMAALAAAGHAVLGDPGPCDAAARIARANGADLDRCAVGAEATVEVVVGVPVRLGPAGNFVASAHARAGPVTAPSG